MLHSRIIYKNAVQQNNFVVGEQQRADMTGGPCFDQYGREGKYTLNRMLTSAMSETESASHINVPTTVVYIEKEAGCELWCHSSVAAIDVENNDDITDANIFTGDIQWFSM